MIIGAGLGGLASAIRLAYRGYQVTILEKEQTVGGKLQRVVSDGYRFDLGPSTITMKHVFESVFEDSGRRMEDYLEFYHLPMGTRNFFEDGSVVDFCPDVDKVEQQIANYSTEDAKQYRAFLKDSAKLYYIANDQFLNKLLYDWKAKLNPKLLVSFLKVKPMTNFDKWLQSYFKHPNTLAMFGRYATYVGSSPYQAPATFGMMAHLEGNQGVYGVKGGTYSIVEAFQKLAEELGVTVQLNTKVERILVKDRRAVGVETNLGTYDADEIIANADALTVREKLLSNDRKLDRVEPSLSGFALLLGVESKYDQLTHHNVFFPQHYKAEFDAIFTYKKMPENPTIYICNSGFTDKTAAGQMTSNLFVLVNAPVVSENTDWTKNKEIVTEKIIAKLEAKGLTGLNKHLTYKCTMTPEDIEQRTGAYKGSIYGMSSNSFKQAFFKIPNKDNQIKHLWYVGGSSHPGGGTPIVTLSGMLVADKIHKINTL